ncbi:hypothetical protein HELRODRAFT_149796, partial [Helobdella robusta]|uniref:protein-tyrosine-phosphatase n=1 Tax=Helobdella robusta TaxID=6412 RepID=T1EKD6_HELRO
SKRTEFKSRNRYGDVSPYDYSRVRLKQDNIDYINASLVKAEEANRAYILTQGPLPDTSGHFWLMVWEQGSSAILMLNRIIEKDHIKCHKYFPSRESRYDEEMTFKDVGLKVKFIDELESNKDFVIRLFELQKLKANDAKNTRQILQFHYMSWPDFGVPDTPTDFLNFLYTVRKYAALDDPSRPPVIHCSAGIGRSGTFCLVDTCLVLYGTLDNINVLGKLMEMRKYRMGLIQTHDQLRFSFIAIVKGASRLKLDDS